MQQNKYNRAKEAFYKYASAYNLKDKRIQLKYEHSLEVAKLCEKIAVIAGINSDDAELAKICGLLHDIGRFEQIQRWGTFNDAASCSHSALGLEVLEGSGAGSIKTFVDDLECASIVKKATALHSCFCLPDNLDARTRLFCGIVRDADKVDIMRVFSTYDSQTVLGVSVDAVVSGKISDLAMKGFREKRCLTPADRTELLDGLVGVVCFVFELALQRSSVVLQGSSNLCSLLDHPFGLSVGFSDYDTRTKWEEIRETLYETNG